MNIRNMISRLGLLALALMASAVLAAEPVSITGIEVSNVTPEKQVIKINFSGDAPSPASFSINTPPRIAFDFANATNQSGKTTVPVTSNVLRMISLAEGSGRTRVVLSLNKQAIHEAKTEGKSVLITVDSATAGAAAPQATQFAVAKPVAGGVEAGIRNIDFRRGENGEGKIIVDLSSPNVGIDIRQQGKNLVVDFAKAALPSKLERRLDVADFGTLVQKVDAIAQGGSTKLVIEPKGSWEYSAYQTESQFTVEVREMVDESKVQAEKKAYKGEKISLNYQNVDVRQALHAFADFAQMNIVTTDSVKGDLTLILKNVPWDQALDLIMKSKDLDMRKIGNVIRIAPRDELAAKEKQALEIKKQIDELVPTRQEMFRLKYHKAVDFEKMLKDEKNKLLTKRGSAVIDALTNTLIINDVPSKLDEIRDIIAKVDQPARQVMIEARVVEATDSFSRELGSKLGIFFSNSASKTVNTSSTASATYTSGSSGGFNLPASTINGFSAGSIGMVAAGAHGILSLELSALESDGKGKVISSPRLVTADRVEATIEDGQEIPYITTQNSGGVITNTVTFKKAVLSLKVTPQITPDGNVIMDLKVNKDSRGTDTVSGPAIDTKVIQTKVLVENGGTIVIGGIYIQTVKTTTDQIPFLGDIPVLGALFRHNTKLSEKRELLIFVSPKVLTPELSLR